MAEDKTRQHFNNIAKNYNEEIPNHIRDHLLLKWWGLVSSYFRQNINVIDIGCGEGTNVAFLNSKGVNCCGIDASKTFISVGKDRHPEIKNKIYEGDALNLQFPSNSFDIASMTGVLHHIHSRRDQIIAIREANRVVNDHGIIIIRESNLINPLFRLFWNYVFPLTSKIDRLGGENWISAKTISDLFNDSLEKIIYFTFLPSFTPQVILPLAGRIEYLLENSSLKKLSAHYLVVLRKSNPL